jgi:hypothetical protein
MGPIAEIAAPILAPVLQPIMQDVGKALGGALDGALGGLTGGLTGGPLGGLTGSLDGIAKGLGGGQQGGVQGGAQPKSFDQQISDIQDMLKQLTKEIGQQQGGLCNPKPLPFSPGKMHFHHENPISGMPHFGDKGFIPGGAHGGGHGNGGGVSGTGNGGNNNVANDDWSSLAANAAGGKSYDQLQSDLQAAEQSGDPAKIAQATNNIQRYDNFVQTLSDAEKKQNDTIAQIIGNLK